MRWVRLTAVLLTLTALAIGSAATPGDKGEPKNGAPEIVINITGDGDMAKYIKEGDKDQLPVAVTVGQTVNWKNKGNKKHTATSKLKVGDKPLFNTGTLKSGESKSITFNKKMFEDAGGTVGGQVNLDYICLIHGEAKMKSSIILKSAEEKKGK